MEGRAVDWGGRFGLSPKGSRDENLQVVWDGIKESYRRRGVRDRFGNLRMGMFVDVRRPRAAFPRLKGKAAELKSFGHPLLDVWQEHMSDECLQHKQVHLLLKSSVKLEDMLHEHKALVRFPEEIADHFLEVACRLLMLATALARHYNTHGKKLWNITIKCHYLYHAAYNARNLSPRLTWTYAGEDYMQQIKRLAQSCVRGTPSWLVGGKIVKKYVRGFTFRFLDRKRWSI